MLNRSHRRSCAETRKNEQITLLHLEKLLMWAWLGQYANLMKQKSIGRPNSYVSSLLTINSLWRGKGKSMLELWIKAMKEKLISTQSVRMPFLFIFYMEDHKEKREK